MSRLMEIKSNVPKVSQKQIAQPLGYEDFTKKKRYRGQINQPSP